VHRVFFENFLKKKKKKKKKGRKWVLVTASNREKEKKKKKKRHLIRLIEKRNKTPATVDISFAKTPEHLHTSIFDIWPSKLPCVGIYILL